MPSCACRLSLRHSVQTAEAPYLNHMEFVLTHTQSPAWVSLPGLSPMLSQIEQLQVDSGVAQSTAQTFDDRSSASGIPPSAGTLLLHHLNGPPAQYAVEKPQA